MTTHPATARTTAAHAGSLASALRHVGLLLLLLVGLARGQGLRAPAAAAADGDLPVQLLHDAEDGQRHGLPPRPHRALQTDVPAVAPARARNLTATTGLVLRGSDAGTRGAAGVMFTLYSATRTVTVRALDFYTGSQAQNQRVQVYARAGKYAGTEVRANGWSLVHDRRVTLRGGRNPTSVDLAGATNIPKGTFRSFFVWIPNDKIRYAASGTEGSVAARDDLLRLYTGVGITSKFSGTRASAVQSPRMFRGKIRYDAAAVASNQNRDPLKATAQTTRLSCRAGQRQIRFQVRTDGAGAETSYVLRKKGGNRQVVSQGPAQNARYRSNTLYQGTVCVDVGMYEFEVKDRGGNGLSGRGYYKSEVQNEDGGWKTVRGAAFQSSKVHVLDAGVTEATMTDRDRDYLLAHNKRRRDWHGRYNKAYVPLRWSKGLRDASKAYAKELLDTCESGSPQHAKQNPYGENIARNKGNGGWAQLYDPDKIVNRFVEREEGLPWARNGHLTNALWRATKYVGCAEASKTYTVSGKTKTCRSQVCRYAKPGNCSMGKYKNQKGIVDWLTPMLMDDSPCKPLCPPEGCYDE